MCENVDEKVKPQVFALLLVGENSWTFVHHWLAICNIDHIFLVCVRPLKYFSTRIRLG